MATPRNVCIIAHVDHGKTTMADSLLASNGIVSHRLAGLGLRYMDSREDEQDRGITMKASCVALTYDGGESDDDQCAVNLIDSPGHVDFCSEVSSAARLSDGALLVVDAVEGVCVQTHAVLKQAWEEHVVPVLVLNKIDRLITELELTPLEAWHHLKNVVEQVNAIAGHLYAGRVLEADARAHTSTAPTSAGDDATAGAPGAPSDSTADVAVDASGGESFDSFGDLQASVGELQFAPERGNVIFASAMHGWGFSLSDFAQLYARKLGMRADVLERTLWGEYFYDPKGKRILRSSNDGKLKPMFVQFVLQSVWRVYTAVITQPDEADRAKIVATLGLDVPARELNHSDPIVQLRAVMNHWLPLGRTVLRAAVQLLPDAKSAQPKRLPHLCPALHAAEACGEGDGEGGGGRSALASLCRGVSSCDASSSCIVLHVAKMVYAAGVHGAHPDDTFVGFARVFAGTLRPGSGGILHVVDAPPPATSSQDSPPDAEPRAVSIDGLRLYVLMGRELVPTDAVAAGGVCGVGGLSGVVARSATLSTEAICPPFAPLAAQSAPVVQVAVEPTQLGMLPELEKGLQLLGRADWSAQVDQLPTGEHVLGTCGEVHLERCLHDLRTTFAPGVELSVSAPIVPLRETAAADSSGLADSATSNKQCTVSVRALRLPEAIATCLRDAHAPLRAALHSGGGCWLEYAADVADATTEVIDVSDVTAPPAAVAALAASVRTHGGKLMAAQLPLSAAPLSSMSNLLLCSAGVASALRPTGGTHASGEASAEGAALCSGLDLLPSVLTGFQLAAGSGPLCDEPMSDVALILERIKLPTDDDDNDATDGGGGSGGGVAGMLEGQLIVAVKDACRAALLACSCRVLEPTYLCELQTSQESMGRMYGVLSKRRAAVVAEELKEGTPIFIIRAHLPVVESFGFAQELRKNTSGAAQPQLLFSHYSEVAQDPNFAVVTEEEQESLDGGEYDGINLARRLVDDVRRRKGLRVEEKAVKVATKQRTLSKKR